MKASPVRMALRLPAIFVYAVTLAVLSGGMLCRCQGQGPAQEISLLDAVRAALDHNLQLQQEHTRINKAASNLQRENGIFDPNFDLGMKQGRYYYPLTDYEHALAVAAGIDTTHQATNFSDLNVQGNKLFETGTRIFTRFDINRNADNLQNLGGVNVTTFQAGLQVPLLGGKGTLVNTARIRAARLDLEGASATLNETTAALVTRTAEHYFGLAAAEARLHTARKAEEDTRTLTGNVEELIRGDKLPAVEIYPARAALDRAHVRTLEVEQAVLEARINLGTDMGLEAMESPALEAEADSFSKIACSPPTPGDWPTLIQASQSHRAATAAAHKLLDAAMARRDAAADAERRRLDLTFDSGYTGLSLGLGADDLLRSAGSRIGGANAEASLTYHFDAGRNAAKADLDAAKADVTTLSVQEKETMQRIGSEVMVAVNGLRLSEGMQKSLESAEESSQLSLDGERTRLLAGEAVLNDVLTAQQRLYDAQLETIGARLRFAVSIVRFRLATGTVISGNSAHPAVESATFYSCGVSPTAPTEKTP